MKNDAGGCVGNEKGLFDTFSKEAQRLRIGMGVKSSSNQIGQSNVIPTLWIDRNLDCVVVGNRKRCNARRQRWMRPGNHLRTQNPSDLLRKRANHGGEAKPAPEIAVVSAPERSAMRDAQRAQIRLKLDHA